MALPATTTKDSQARISAIINALVRQYNRTDTFPVIYGGAETGTGAAYVIKPTPGIGSVGYEVGQIIVLQAIHANTSTTPTLNVNGLGAGTIKYPNGSALGLGDIAANGWIGLLTTSTTPTFALIWH